MLTCDQKVSQVIKKYIKQLFPTLLIYQHIRMMPERSCDTKNWSNGWWKFSFASQK